jgi:hypothetical protein
MKWICKNISVFFKNVEKYTLLWNRPGHKRVKKLKLREF